MDPSNVENLQTLVELLRSRLSRLKSQNSWANLADQDDDVDLEQENADLEQENADLKQGNADLKEQVTTLAKLVKSLTTKLRDSNTLNKKIMEQIPRSRVDTADETIMKKPIDEQEAIITDQAAIITDKNADVADPNVVKKKTYADATASTCNIWKRSDAAASTFTILKKPASAKKSIDDTRNNVTGSGSLLTYIRKQPSNKRVTLKGLINPTYWKDTKKAAKVKTWIKELSREGKIFINKGGQITICG